jgi:hypothetical protein
VLIPIMLLSAMTLRNLAAFQAGGGGNFGGGGGGGFGGGGFGGGGFGGGGGDGEFVGAILRWTWEHPVAGIALWMTLAVLMYWSTSVGQDYRITRSIRRGRKRQQSERMLEAFRRIATVDPEFSKPQFLQRVRQAFTTVQAFWSQQELRRCRAFVSDGVHERFSLYIQMQQAEGLRDRIDDLKIIECDVVAVNSESTVDTLHVRISANASIASEKLEARKASSRSAPRKDFTEVWSFSRRRGARTQQRFSLLEGRCPHCGASLEVVDRAQCPNCQSIVNSGSFDWVLSEITQDCEWLLPDDESSEIPGWNALRKVDPGLSLQLLEDRASVVFWRCLMALYFRKRTLAAPVLFQSLPDVPAPWSFAEGGFWKLAATGSVQVLRCQPASTDKGFQKVVVLLRWSATKAVGDRNKPQLIGHQKIYAHQITMIRRPSAVTDLEAPFSSFSCRACGAPIDPGGAESCRYCLKPLNDGSYEWVLEAVDLHHAFSETATADRQAVDSGNLSAAQTRNLATSIAPVDLLIAAIRLLLVDGEVPDAETQFIQGLAKRHNVPQFHLEQCIETAKESLDENVLPANKEQAKIMMNDLLLVAFADGKVTGLEAEMLLRMSSPLGWTKTDLKQAIARTRKTLHQQGRKKVRSR